MAMLSKLLAILRRGRRSLNRYGVRGSAGYLYRSGRSWLRRNILHTEKPTAGELLDRQFQLETTMTIGDAAYLDGVKSSNWRHANKYEPSEPERFHLLMKQLPIRFDEYTFVDFGSGKGRALLMASEYPFKKIVGFELAPSFHAVAERNIAKWRQTRPDCDRITSVLSDAANAAIPEGPLVAYFFNPFMETVLEQVVVNLIASYARTAQPLYAVCYVVRNEQVLASRGFDEIFTTVDSDGRRHAIFRLLGKTGIIEGNEKNA